MGHIRNAVLGEAFVRCFEQIGHPVTAANYFGDEGQHIATCLWQLQREAKEQNIELRILLDSIAETERAEWLGKFYSRGVEALALDTLTILPYRGVIAAQVKSKSSHPSSKAPANWQVVKVIYGDMTATVVCGGTGYEVDNIVAYVPIGNTFDGKLINPLDKQGIISHGIILSKRELGVSTFFLCVCGCGV